MARGHFVAFVKYRACKIVRTLKMKSYIDSITIFPFLFLNSWEHFVVEGERGRRWFPSWLPRGRPKPEPRLKQQQLNRSYYSGWKNICRLPSLSWFGTELCGTRERVILAWRHMMQHRNVNIGIPRHCHHFSVGPWILRVLELTQKL